MFHQVFAEKLTFGVTFGVLSSAVKFSAITPKALQDAFRTLEEPDSDLSRSVDARQELDLRIGVALTR